jgi:hypothetical protein
VEADAPAPAAPARARAGIDAHAMALVLVALKALSQRSIVALGQIAIVGALASVWWLFYDAIPANPSVNQLVGLTLYGVFVLVGLFAWRR